MIPNINPETGIAYGVVSLNSLADWVFDEFFYNGTSLTYKAAVEEWRADTDAPDDEYPPEEITDGWQFDEEVWELETDGMQLGLSYLGGAPLVWVFASPVATYARGCSPCVPGAGDLDSVGKGQHGDGNVRCYTLPDGWWRSDDE
jgi:hypothetical protein